MDGDPNEKYVILQNIGMSLLRDFFKSSSLYFLGNVLTKLIVDKAHNTHVDIEK